LKVENIRQKGKYVKGKNREKRPRQGHMSVRINEGIPEKTGCENDAQQGEPKGCVKKKKPS